MKTIFYSLICLLAISCKSDFTKITQAKNEVNKKGFRIGRWVEFQDSTGIIEDTAKGYSGYILSEYNEGTPIGETKFYTRDGVLKTVAVAHEGVNQKMEKTRNYQVIFKEVTSLNEKGDPLQINRFDEKNTLLEQNMFTTNGILQKKQYELAYVDGDLKSYKTTYYFSGSKDSFSIWTKFSESSQYKNQYEKSILRYLKEYLQNKIEGEYPKVLNDSFILNDIMAETIINTSKLRFYPFGIDYVVFDNKDTLALSSLVKNKRNELAAAAEREYQRQVIASYYEQQYQRQRERESRSYSYSQSCDWCGRSFSGDHYTHMGRLADCYSTSQSRTINKFCSMRCCAESRSRR